MKMFKCMFFKCHLGNIFMASFPKYDIFPKHIFDKYVSQIYFKYISNIFPKCQLYFPNIFVIFDKHIRNISGIYMTKYIHDVISQIFISGHFPNVCSLNVFMFSKVP
jgi:hypothetical protein